MDHLRWKKARASFSSGSLLAMWKRVTNVPSGVLHMQYVSEKERECHPKPCDSINTRCLNVPRSGCQQLEQIVASYTAPSCITCWVIPMCARSHSICASTGHGYSSRSQRSLKGLSGWLRSQFANETSFRGTAFSPPEPMRSRDEASALPFLLLVAPPTGSVMDTTLDSFGGTGVGAESGGPSPFRSGERFRGSDKRGSVDCPVRLQALDLTLPGGDCLCYNTHGLFSGTVSSTARRDRRGRARPWVRILAQRGLAGQTEPVPLRLCLRPRPDLGSRGGRNGASARASLPTPGPGGCPGCC